MTMTDAYGHDPWMGVRHKDVEDAEDETLLNELTIVTDETVVERAHNEGKSEGQRENGNKRRLTIIALGIILVFIVVIVLLSTLIPLSQRRKAAEGTQVESAVSAPASFDWTKLKASTSLSWTKCYDNFECARLLVPLDYSDTKAGSAAVALVKYPAKVSSRDKKYRGPVLFNPGGPGGSGTYFILLPGLAQGFQTILGDEYDIVGFDPRGIGYTTPGLFPFSTDGSNDPEQSYLALQSVENLNSSSNSLYSLYGKAQILGNIGYDRLRDVAPYIGTPTVARDMLKIVEAFEQDKLQYWGFSYGTVLGATFATMFPDRIERMIMDGVVDIEEYYAGSWSSNLIDADATLFAIYHACVNAGPLLCPLWEMSAEKIHIRVAKLLKLVQAQPISFYDDVTSVYGQVDYAATKMAMLLTLYNAQASGRELMKALFALENGNPKQIHDMSEKSNLVYDLTHNSCTCPPDPVIPFASSVISSLSILCGDALPNRELPEQLRDIYDDMYKTSIFADAWTIRLACSGWKMSAKERYGNFKETNTSFPLMLIGNTADPVTPLRSAHKMSKFFVGSRVLTQNSAGHCSISAVSSCTMRAVRGYLRDGALPAAGTVCQTHDRTFEALPIDMDALKLNNEERTLFEASYALAKNYPIPRLAQMM